MVSAAGCYPALASASPFDSGTFRYVLSPPPFAAVQWWTPGFVPRLARVRLAPAAPMSLDDLMLLQPPNAAPARRLNGTPSPLTDEGAVRTFWPMSESETKPVKRTWRDVIEGVITSASEDPDQFVDDVKATARSASGKLDGILQRIKDHPDIPKRAARNAVIKNVAAKIRREFRF